MFDFASALGKEPLDFKSSAGLGPTFVIAVVLLMGLTETRANVFTCDQSHTGTQIFILAHMKSEIAYQSYTTATSLRITDNTDL